MGLSTALKLEYERVDFTATDVGLILKILWLHADLVIASVPQSRVGLHALVLLFALGFWQGMIISMTYGDAWNCSRLTTTFMIWRNKLRVNTLEHKKGGNFQFTTTLLPYALFYLTYLVCVIGVHFKAFKEGDGSIDDLHKPHLENVDCVRLDWREGIVGREIFPGSYTAF